MPTYEYRCKKGHTFEVMQRITDDPMATCEVCGAPVQRVLHPVAVHFKGSGFYNTDYGTRKRQRETAAAGEGKKGSGSSSSGESSANGAAPKDKKDSSAGKGKGEAKAGSSGDH
jgi:putative FmdB family regulatory protein